MRKRRALLALVLVIATLTGSIYLLSRPRTDVFAVIGKAPFDARVIPRSAFDQKPYIDFSMPVLGRIRIPNFPQMPKEYLDTKEVSGLVATSIPTSPPTTVAAMMPVFWPITLNRIDFGADGLRKLERIETTKTTVKGSTTMSTLPSYAALPYVFGKGPRIVTLLPDSSLKLPSVKLRLPGNGMDEPTLPAVSAQAGRWRVTLAPKKWLSPSLSLFVDLKLSGGRPGEIAFVMLDDSVFYYDYSFSMRTGGVIALSWKKWAANRTYKVRVDKCVSESRQLRVRVTPKIVDGTSIKEVAVLWEDGKEVAHFDLEKTGWHGLDQDQRGYLSIRIGPALLSGSDYETAPNQFRTSWNPLTAKDGMILKATCLKPVETGKAQLELPYPASSQFRNWKEGDSL